MKHRGEALSLDVRPALGGEKGTQGRGLPKGAKLFNCCQFPLKRTHREDWVKQSQQRSLLRACLCFHMRVVHVQKPHLLVPT